MEIKFHDLQSPYQCYKDEINDAIQAVLQSSQYIMGNTVKNLEISLANYLQCNHVITCASGTDALLLSLMAIEIKPGDEVITTPFSFISAAEAICLLGATPVFVDIEPDTYNIKATAIENKITEKTRAIIPASLFGQPADMDDINKIATNYTHQFSRKIFVIEDAAQSFGATYKSRPSGNLSDIGCLSFFPTKPLGCYGDGGAIATNDGMMAEKIKSLRIHGQSKRYQHQYIGINSRLDAIQAAILEVKLKYLNEELKQRQNIANYYQKHLNGYNIILPEIKSDRSSAYAQFSIRIQQREQLISSLKNKNIPTAIHYPLPIHLQPCLDYLHYRIGDFPVAETAANEILSLPMHPFLTELQLKYIVNGITGFLDQRNLTAERFKLNG